MSLCACRSSLASGPDGFLALLIWMEKERYQNIWDFQCSRPVSRVLQAFVRTVFGRVSQSISFRGLA